MPNQFQNIREFFKPRDKATDIFRGDKALEEYLKRRYQALQDEYSAFQQAHDQLGGEENEIAGKSIDNLSGRLQELEVIAGHLDLNIYDKDTNTNNS